MSVFASFVGLVIGITSCAVGLEIFAISTGIKMYKLIIQKRQKTHYKVVLLGKTKLDTAKVLISKV